MAEMLDLVLIAGVGGGGLAYVTNFKGFKDWVDSQLHFGGGNGGGCNGHCTAGYHLVTSSCTCVPDTCTKTCPTGQHVSSTCTCVPDTNGGGGGGGTGTWYKANGPTAAMPHVRVSSGNCGKSSGGNSGGNRWENEVKGFFDIGYEVVVYFQIPAGKMCSGGHIGLKHGGPNHTSPCDYQTSGPCGGSGCCCWWDTGIDNDQGKSYIEIEGSHPNNCHRKYFASVGRLDTGRPFGVRWHISKEGSGIRLMQWVDKSGKAGANEWFQTYNVLDTGQFMPKSYYSHITNLQNIEIRISDAASGDIKMVQAPVSRKIVAGSGYTQVLPTGYVSRYTDLVKPMFVH